jgi:hypothetical protein
LAPVGYRYGEVAAKRAADLRDGDVRAGGRAQHLGTAVREVGRPREGAHERALPRLLMVSPAACALARCSSRAGSPYGRIPAAVKLFHRDEPRCRVRAFG